MVRYILLMENNLGQQANEVATNSDFDVANVMEYVKEVISFIANLSTILIVVLTIYTFYKKRKSISDFLRFVIRYSIQSTLRELENMIDGARIAFENKEKERASKTLSQMVGTIKGNSDLKNHLSETVVEMEKIIRALDTNRDTSGLDNRAYLLLSKLRQELMYFNIQIQEE